MEVENIFITGGTSGIGLSFAKHYVRQGLRVGVCGGKLSDQQKLLKENPQLNFYEWDVTNHQEGGQVLKSFCGDQQLSKLIMCAGINDGAPYADLALDFDRSRSIINVNVIGILNSIEAAYPFLKSGSHIIALSSAAALGGFPSAPVYSASKAAIMTLCESLSIRFKPLSIYVTCLMPGYIDTPLARSTHPELEKMPFLLTPQPALSHMLTAIDQKKRRLIFPWQIKLIGLTFQMMPRCLFAWLYTRIENSDHAKKSRGLDH
jgi:short-subunit dehydrogenase